AVRYRGHIRADVERRGGQAGLAADGDLHRGAFSGGTVLGAAHEQDTDHAASICTWPIAGQHGPGEAP
ncbi:unnamed protein product, partial [Effrenium voratum]